ncbi:hypothetical protein [Massilia endophytica]|uniref:hypothetical protein n=1 Tax=Massilia endophytica TaxID=2899220 RepID=UPI001E378D83|nr:hypothetical protein [Massilia endophytica]UGQ45773.1 hypothetical protein LSQ66_18575 [Massilia endophytica]
MRLSRTILSAALLALGAAPLAQAGNPYADYVPPLSAQPLNRIVQDNAYKQLDYFFRKLAEEKEGIKIDGYAPFKSGDKFLPGKVAAGLGHALLNTPKDDPRLPQLLQQYSDIADMTVDMDNHTWGIYYYMLMLRQLKDAGLLERAIKPATLEKLRRQLDWRAFVTQPGYELMNLPTNYYGVAFSIARLRVLMGWEDDSGAKVLLNKMLEHYAAYSGKYGFSDETSGEGRFDRYSILLIAEICERFVETGVEVTPDLKAMLRKAATVALNVANPSGSGFSFGRSLGPYGETAMLEILSISAYLGVLTPEEKEYAYAYSSRIAARYMDFWFNPAMNSVDMWNQGRRTDTYRGKHRILGENFSLLHQLIFTNEQWNMAGMKDKAPRQDLQAWLDKTQPKFSLTWFAQGEYDRAMAVFRDRKNVFSLLMINGGQSQYNNSPYYPLPFAPGIVSGIADSGSAHPQLLPKITLADGTELLGTSYIRNIKDSRKGGRYTVSYHQDELAKQGGKAPAKDSRIKLDSVYTMAPGVITRTDTYTPVGKQEVKQISLDFASFSDGAKVQAGTVRFAEGAVYEYSVKGLGGCKAEPTNGSDLYKAPYGPMKTLVSCSSGQLTMDKPLVIQWTLKYR